MVAEYARPMLDIGSPRVFNVNMLTRNLLAKDPSLTPFFQNRKLNNIVMIKDAVPDSDTKVSTGIGTKLYFPFNENDVYEGGRTIFRHDAHLEKALVDMFGRDALPAAALAEDMRKMAIIDRLPSLDPFLMKDVFLNEGFAIDETYFEVGKELWQQIESFILERFEPVVRAAFPDALASDDKARLLVQKIWEARDLQALKPLIDAFRLPNDEALEIFAAWKGINFYAFQYTQIKPVSVQMVGWLQTLQLPVMNAVERGDNKAMIELIKAQIKLDWQKIESVLQNYQDSYDKMFKLRISSSEFCGVP